MIQMDICLNDRITDRNQTEIINRFLFFFFFFFKSRQEEDQRNRMIIKTSFDLKSTEDECRRLCKVLPNADSGIRLKKETDSCLLHFINDDNVCFKAGSLGKQGVYHHRLKITSAP